MEFHLATGALIPESKLQGLILAEYSSNTEPTRCFGQSDYCHKKAQNLHVHRDDLEQDLFDAKVGGTPFDFMADQPYSVEDTWELWGGVWKPFVVILNEHSEHKWPWLTLIKDEELKNTLRDEGRHVRCLFSPYY